VVDKAVVLIGTRGKDYGAGRFGGCFLNRVKYLLSLRKKLVAVAVLGRLTLLDRSADSFGGNPECVFHKPGQLALTIRIARKTMRIVWQNIVFALGVKFAILALAVAGIATMWLAVFGDVGVAVIAILNALRALRPVKAG
jgi:hypothetical protein